MDAIALELRTACAGCARPVPINALTPTVTCATCLHTVAVSDEEWNDLLDLAIADLAGLLNLVQAGVVEIHPWGSPADDLELAHIVEPAEPHGINSEGLKRRGFAADGIAAIRRAYKTLYKAGLGLAEAREAIRADVPGRPELLPLIEFLDSAGRGIIR